MLLKKEDKKRLRNEINQKLIEVPEGTRIHIDKDVLDQLFFDTYKETLKETGEQVSVKYFAWFNSNTIQKIDLSELSTENVMWDFDYYPGDYFISGENHYRYGDVLYLANTNLKPNFQEGFKNTDESLFITKVYFDNVDLSSATLPKNLVIRDCSFDNTNIPLNLDDFESLEITNSSLSGIDLSACTIEPQIFDEYCEKFILDSWLQYTKAKIILPDHQTVDEATQERFDELKDLCCLLDSEQAEYDAIKKEIECIEKNNEVRKLIGLYIKQGRLKGCYVNGHLIHDSEELAQIKNQIEESYNNYMVDIRTSIDDSIDRQLSMTPKKNTDVK